VLFVIAMQIIFILKTNHTSVDGEEFAEPYDSFVELASVVDLDVPRLVPFGCFVETSWDHVDSLVSITLAPVFIFVFGSFVIFSWPYETPHDQAKALARFRYYFARFMLLAYPAISRTICQCFRCDEYVGGDVLLKADLSIACETDQYVGMVVYAVLCSLIYSAGIPAVVWLKLWRWRHELNPLKYEDEARAIKVRVRVRLWAGRQV